MNFITILFAYHDGNKEFPVENPISDILQRLARTELSILKDFVLVGN